MSSQACRSRRSGGRPLDVAQRLAQGLGRLGVGVALDRRLGEEAEVLHGLLGPGGLGVVVGQPVVDLAQTIRVERLVGRARGLVQAAPAAREQALVRDVLGEGVVEDVDGLALAALLVDELQAPELREVGLEAAGAAPDGLEQPERELASQHRGGLEHPSRLLRQPIDARQQHVVHACRARGARARSARRRAAPGPAPPGRTGCRRPSPRSRSSASGSAARSPRTARSTTRLSARVNRGRASWVAYDACIQGAW